MAQPYDTDPIQVQQFMNDVKHVYQGMGKGLSAYARVRSGVIGISTHFDLLDQVTVEEKPNAPGTDIPVSNATWTRVTCLLKNYVAGKYSDIFKQREILPSERMEVAMALVKGAMRREDQIILDEFLAAVTASGTQATSLVLDDAFPNDGEQMSVAVLRRIGRIFDHENIPEDGRHVVMGAYAKEELLDDERYVSRDYANSTKLDSGMMPDYYGMKLHLIGKREEGGLPEINSKPVLYAWHQEAIGVARSLEHQVRVGWVEQKLSWLTTIFFRCGAKTREGKGLVRVTFAAS